MKNNIVIGAGISGLSFGYFSKDTNIIFEREDAAGGLCKSVKKDGFVFDCSGHFIHIKDSRIKVFVKKFSGEKLLKLNRKSSIYFKNRLIPYPFQANLYYLDKKEKQECINGVKNRPDIRIYDDMPFIDWCRAMFGTGITKYFMQPYNSKLWNYDLKKMTAAWTAPFVPKPSAKSIIKTAYEKNTDTYGYNSCFYYPEKGCGELIKNIYSNIKNSVMLNTAVSRIDYKNKFVVSYGTKYFYNNLICTQPADILLEMTDNLPKEISLLKKNLKVTAVRCINIGIKYKKGIPELIKNRHWIYFPEKKYPFYRVGIYSNISPKLVPSGCYSIYVELSSYAKDMSFMQIADILRRIGVIGEKDEIITQNTVSMPYSYVIFDKKRDRTLSVIKKFFEQNNIYLLGRYGAWEYSFIEKNIKDAAELAFKLNSKK